MIKFEDFEKLDIRIGKVLSAEKVEKSNKLIKLEVDLGKEKRQIIAGMTEFFDIPSELIGKEMPILINIEPRKFRRYDSYGMIIAADVNDKPILLYPEKEIPPGSIIR